MAHGLADLLASGRLESLGSMTGEARDEMVAAIIRRVLPAV
jgi:hypothetical protein